MTDDLTRLAFGGLAPSRIDRLMERYESPKRVLRAIEHHRVKVTDRVRDAVSVDTAIRRTQLSDLGVSLVFEDDAAFPKRLLDYESHPRWLFIRGSGVPKPAVGIVGTRACTAYGLELAEMYGHVAANAGWSVVSGLARGIDGAAHRGTVNAKGHCHAVLGSGIDVVYPVANRTLFRSILDSGGLITSEYPPGTPPEGWRFPTGNRQQRHRHGIAQTRERAMEKRPILYVDGERLLGGDAFESWTGDELAHFVEQLEGMEIYRRDDDIKSKLPDEEQRGWLRENTEDNFYWFVHTIVEASDAYVTVKQRELDRAVMTRQEIDIALGLSAKSSPEDAEVSA